MSERLLFKAARVGSTLLIVPLLLALAGGCKALGSSETLSSGGGKPSKEFMQRVADDPFPTAAQSGLVR